MEEGRGRWAGSEGCGCVGRWGLAGRLILVVGGVGGCGRSNECNRSNKWSAKVWRRSLSGGGEGHWAGR